MLTDQPGAQLAQDVLSLPYLLKIRLDLLFSTETDTLALVVPSTSLIEELLMNGPIQPCISLKLGKTAMSLQCCGTDVSSVKEPTDLFLFGLSNTSCAHSL